MTITKRFVWCVALIVVAALADRSSLAFAPAAAPAARLKAINARSSSAGASLVIEASEPVHLIELIIEGDAENFDIGEVTQELAGQPKSNWQAPYDERVLEESEGRIRYGFFFHYLDFKAPLLTPAGSLPKRFPMVLS